MKDILVFVVLGLLGVMSFSCGGGGVSSPELTPGDIDKWLDSKMTQEPKADLSGKWDGGSAFSGGWGEGNFVQEGSRFSGSMGMYYVKGVVSGANIYLALLSSGRVYYTAHLTRKEDGSFFGKAVSSVLVDSEAASNAEIFAMSLKKMN